MKKLAIVSSFAVTAVSIAAQKAPRQDWGFHRDLLREKFDTSYWHEFWTDDSWRIKCIFVDMDGDGTEEMIAITPSDEDRMGDYWGFWRSCPGKFKKCSLQGDIWFTCFWESFFVMSHADGGSSVVGLGLDAGYRDAVGRKTVRQTPDCFFRINADDNCLLEEIKPDFDTVFRREDVIGMERLYPELYFGYDFAPPTDEPWFASHMPYKLPKGDLRRGGGMTAPDDFATFAAGRCRDVETRTGKVPTVSYAVFLDADNDGDADCYVSSDAEAVSGGAFDWTLFLRRDGCFEKAGTDVFPVAAQQEDCRLPVSVRAGKSSFCRIVRYDINPTFVILNGESDPRTNVKDIALSGRFVHRIEKLHCMTFATP